MPQPLFLFQDSGRTNRATEEKIRDQSFRKAFEYWDSNELETTEKMLQARTYIVALVH